MTKAGYLPDPYSIVAGNPELTGDLNLTSQVQYHEENYTLTGIGYYSFYRCEMLTGSLTIPNSVQNIGNSAFYGCVRFTGFLTIGNSVQSIGIYAFDGCSGFDKVISKAEIAPLTDQAFDEETYENVPCMCRKNQ